MLELLLKENTEALKALAIALAAAHLGGAAVLPKPDPKAPPAAAKGPAAPAAPTGAALDYEKDVKPLALRVAKEKSRDALVAILGTFKVAQANLLKPEQYGPFITACNTALTTVAA